MKVKCEYCQNDFKGKIREPFDKFSVGRVICPACSKENKRYISEFDLLLYFFSSCVLYTIGVFGINLIFNYYFTKDWILSLAIMFVLLTIGYFLSDLAAKYIYFKAPYKETWKNRDLRQDHDIVARRLNQQFILFIAISFLIGTQPEMLYIYLVIALALIAFILIKANLAYKNEKTLIETKSSKKS